MRTSQVTLHFCLSAPAWAPAWTAAGEEDSRGQPGYPLVWGFLRGLLPSPNFEGFYGPLDLPLLSSELYFILSLALSFPICTIGKESMPL